MTNPKKPWDTRLTQALGLLEQAHETLAELDRELPIGHRVNGSLVTGFVQSARISAGEAVVDVKWLVDL